MDCGIFNLMLRLLVLVCVLSATGCSLLFSQEASSADDAGVEFDADLSPDASIYTECGYSCETYRIDTVAGTGIAGPAVDDQQATLAQLNFPAGLDVDSQGNLYIADKLNHRIRKVDLQGNIATVAGGGGLTAEGSPAIAFELNEPIDVAVAANGEFFIADAGSHRVLVVDTGGMIKTYAGMAGQPGDDGDGAVGTAAKLNTPTSLALDGEGNLFIADRLSHRVRIVIAADGFIYAYAGTGAPGSSGDEGAAISATLSRPRGIALDSMANLFIAELDNNRIRHVSAGTKTITTFAGSGEAGFFGDVGLAASAEFNTPSGVAVDALDNLLIADKLNHRIRQVEGTSSIVSTLAGEAVPGFGGDGFDARRAQLNQPVDVAAGPLSSIYFVDQQNERVRRLGLDDSACEKGICPDGGCAQLCRELECEGACAGGGCTQTCEMGSTCRFSCARGGCIQTCQDGASCYFSCLGGGCTQTSEPGAVVLDCPAD